MMAMPEYSVFTQYGFLEYDSENPDAENIYDSMRAGHTDKRTGLPAIDTTVGTYHEAKLYARACAIADGNASIRRAANQGDALKETESLPHDEKAYRLVPRPGATLEERRAAVAERRLIPRGTRYEAIYDALTIILGDDLIAVRPIAPEEATTWPSSPGAGPGVFARPEQPAKAVRFLEPVTGPFTEPSDSYSELLADTADGLISTAGVNFSAIGQAFTGNGGVLALARFLLATNGAPTGAAVAKIYAHSGTFGSSAVPTGAALATSNPFAVSVLTATPTLIALLFSGSNRITLVDAAKYFVVIEYSAGSIGNSVDVYYQLSGSHDGNAATFDSPTWSAYAGSDLAFYVETVREIDVAYENWDTTEPALQLARGDVLCVEPENLGLAEKVTLVRVDGTEATRRLTAVFAKPHDDRCSATTGLTPLWWSDTGHLLIVVTDEAALDAEFVDRIDACLTRVAKAGTTWSIVEPTEPGDPTVGPFTLGTSPLGAVTVGELEVATSLAPLFVALQPTSVAAAGGLTTIYGHRLGEVTAVMVDAVSVSFVIVDAHRIRITVPATAAGLHDITIVAPAGTTIELDALLIV